MKTGIHVKGGFNLIATNNTFDNVPTPFDTDGIKSGHVTGTRIKNDPKLGPAARTGASTGWRRPKGPPLPIFCPSCKSISASQNYVFGGLYFQFLDNEEACPECGFGGARLSEGLFNLAGEIATALSAPDITYSMLSAISALQAEALSGRISVAEATAKVEQINKPLGAIWKAALALCVTALPFVFAATDLYLQKMDMDLHRREVELMGEQTDIMRSQSSDSRDDVATQRLLEKLLESLAQVRIVSEPADSEQPLGQPVPPYPKSKPNG